MITLRDFIDLSMENFYKINVFNTNNGTLVFRQVEVGQIEEELEKNDMSDYLDLNIESWDIEEISKELCVNIGE